MTTRLLPSSEWARLDGFACAAMLPFLTDDSGRVLVAEEDGRIVGAAVLWQEVRFDGFEVTPDQRYRSTATRALLTLAADESCKIGAGLVVSAPKNAAIEQLIQRCDGIRLPGTYQWSLERAVDVLYGRERA